MPSNGELSGPGVVLCPPLSSDLPVPAWHDALAHRLAEVGTPVVRPAAPPLSPDPIGGTSRDADLRLALASWVAVQAIAITAARLDRPLVLVAEGESTRGLPALGFSQRASRHHVVGYVLVDGPLPTVGPAARDWPDAPVLCVRHAAQQDDGAVTGAQLRGWPVVHDDPVSAIDALVRHWPAHPA